MLHALFALVATLLIVATVLPLTRWRHYLVRGWDFPRLQLATLLALWLAFWLVLRADGGGPSPLWALALGAALAWQMRWILPWTELHAQEVMTASPHERTSRPHLRVITSNVLMDNRDAERLLAHVRRERPDVLVTLESDSWWQEQLDTLEELPHRIACPLDNRYGMHVYSRLPLHGSRIDFVVDDDVPSMFARVELSDGTRVRFHVVHPTPPAPGENERSTERDVELLLLARRLDGPRDPTIVTGDLNDVAWSATTRLFRARSGLLDPRVGRGMYNTFHADHWYLRWPLDHMFVSEHFRVREVRRLAAIGSDHFPVLFDVVIAAPVEPETRAEMDEEDRALERDTLATDVAREALGSDALAATREPTDTSAASPPDGAAVIARP